MKWKYMASLGAYGWGYNAWPTQCNVSRERSTLRVSLSSFLPHDKRLWNSYLCNISIGFDNSRCMWKLVVYRGATLYPLCHRANHRVKLWVLYREEFQRPLVGSRDEPKSYKIIFPCKSVKSTISLYIGHSLGNNYLLANRPSIQSACHQFAPRCVSNFNYVWRDFPTS